LKTSRLRRFPDHGTPFAKYLGTEMSAESLPYESLAEAAMPPLRIRFPATPVSHMPTRNFEFLREYHLELADLGGFAEAWRRLLDRSQRAT
jgi:hypothetical protein